MKIENSQQLRQLYDVPKERAQKKQLAALEKHTINFINKSPFLVISTVNKEGKMDVSPRGGNPGFVQVLNEKQIAIPDAKGNNRIDSLVNIVETGRLGALFFIPGVDETLRLNGSTYISTDEAHLNLFSSERIPPKTCIIINIEEAFLHCAKALMRSNLWREESKIERKSFPTMGQMLKDQIGSDEEPESQQAMVKRYLEDI